MDMVHLIAQVEQILELQADPMDLVDQVDWVACNRVDLMLYCSATWWTLP